MGRGEVWWKKVFLRNKANLVAHNRTDRPSVPQETIEQIGEDGGFISPLKGQT